MAIDYTTLTGAKTVAGSIANWVNRSDLPTDNILLEAESFIYERMRVREMMTRAAAFTFDLGVDTEALPADFLDPIQFHPYEWGSPLPLYHEEKALPSTDSTGAVFAGEPSRWWVLGVTAYIDTLPTADFIGALTYYARPLALSGSNETNWLTIRYPTLLRHALLYMAYDHMKEIEMSNRYLQTFEGKLAESKRTNDMFRRSSHVPAHSGPAMSGS